MHIGMADIQQKKQFFRKKYRRDSFLDGNKNKDRFIYQFYFLSQGKQRIKIFYKNNKTIRKNSLKKNKM